MVDGATRARPALNSLFGVDFTEYVNVPVGESRFSRLVKHIEGVYPFLYIAHKQILQHLSNSSNSKVRGHRSIFAEILTRLTAG